MHLSVSFSDDYPLSPPVIQMNSKISHPNIFGTYICASILNTTEGYTPAYTLKGIAIQLLSFFSSDRIEQSGGRYSFRLSDYRDNHEYLKDDTYVCQKCNFGKGQPSNFSGSSVIVPVQAPPEVQDLRYWPTPQESTILGKHLANGERKASSPSVAEGPSKDAPEKTPVKVAANEAPSIQKAKLPDEIILAICESLETEDLMVFAEAWDRIGSIMTKYDVIRTRELQCFCLKKDYTVNNIKLGVGVSVTQKGRLGFFESEFDLLSQEGFKAHGIRRSVQGVPFENWLPLPISYGHWRKVHGNVSVALATLAIRAKLGDVSHGQVLYHFMNDVVVKLNQQTSQATYRAPYYPYEEQAKSTLTHASEKAIESYFHLFHLLLCLATSQPSIIQSANTTLNAFIAGKTSKKDCPNLGHLLVAALISDVEMTPAVIRSIIKETITRNVVWMLDSKGAKMPELSYMEPSDISAYRLKHTFEASKTSYRLLMFLNLFRKAAVGSPRKHLPVILDEAFQRHGAPPRGSAKKLADAIKRIHAIDNFPEFLDSMGIEKPSGAWFTSFLRSCVEASVEKGYSKMPLNQKHALYLRQMKEPDVEVREGLVPVQVDLSGKTFFPGTIGFGQGHRGGRGGRGGRGRGRGGYPY